MSAEDEIRTRNRMIRARPGDGSACTVLHIGKERTGHATGGAAGPEEPIIAHLGSVSSATRYFHHAPPTPGELQQALRGVEDELLRAVTTDPADRPLLTADGGIRAIARAAGLPPGRALELSREAVEMTFERLVRVSAGRPASVEGLPQEPGFGATLLILRELMHHGGYAAIHIRSPAYAVARR
ncbi:MAG TPA: hypothetical protein VFA86_11380 [Gammaproteobacteria bacterium]|nr:hypothetical protein [Gammaproteobacteria bacterium]